VTIPTQNAARVRRRRREHERQAVIFGTLALVLVGIGLYALAIFTGAVDSPFKRDFTLPASEVEPIPPCLPPGQSGIVRPVTYSEIDLTVFNASGLQVALAGAYRTVLSDRGFVITDALNADPDITYNELRFGPQGIVAAYTVATQFPEIRLVLDDRTGASVDLLIGSQYALGLPNGGLLDVSQVSFEPLTDLRGCKPASQIEAQPSFVPTPPASPEPEQGATTQD
jgi:hypothetical protein